MKRQTLHISLFLILTGLSSLIVWAFIAQSNDAIQKLSPEVIASTIGLVGGLLAIIFRSRGEFVDTLRIEWRDCLIAMAAIRSLYVRASPSEGHYIDALEKLSMAIEGMRSVYKNQGESQHHVGYFPYASLHDVRIILEYDLSRAEPLGFEIRQKRLDQINGIWRMFRRHFLSELALPETDKPVLSRGTMDPRKNGIGWASRVLRRIKPHTSITPEDLNLDT